MNPNTNGDCPDELLKKRFEFLDKALELALTVNQIRPHERNYSALPGSSPDYSRALLIFEDFDHCFNRLLEFVNSEMETLTDYIELRNRK